MTMTDLIEGVRVEWPAWLRTGTPSPRLHQLVDSARFGYRMTYGETLACFERALGVPINPAEFDSMMEMLDELDAN